MTQTATGILKIGKNQVGWLYNPATMNRDVQLSAELIKKFKLVDGATVTGESSSGKKGARLTRVDTISGLKPDLFQQRTPFRELVAISPNERFNLALHGNISMRLVDLIAPIGKGTRGLIVSPPKAGKTTLVSQMAEAIMAADDETRLIILLIDERPEEVTHFRRAFPQAEVFASSSDQPVQEHVDLSELMLAHIRVELECGRNVVVLVDSLTRLVRAFNLKGPQRGRSRTMSGGIEAQALTLPRQFFGLARNIEHGGSVTIIGTILAETGSRMDDFIYEEFKGTGNSEVVLDRALAEAYMFPAINLAASGTRKEDHLYEPADSRALMAIRRALAGRSPKQALTALLNLLEKFPTNDALLQSIGKKTA